MPPFQRFAMRLERALQLDTDDTTSPIMIYVFDEEERAFVSIIVSLVKQEPIPLPETWISLLGLHDVLHGASEFRVAFSNVSSREIDDFFGFGHPVHHIA